MKPFLTRKATTKGGRNGTIDETQSGLTLKLGKPEEMGGEPTEKTNPEEIFSAGYSACFASSIEYLLMNSKTSYEAIEVTATTALIPDGDAGFKFALEVSVSIQGLDKDTEKEFTKKAFDFCPYSKAIKGNVDVFFK